MAGSLWWCLGACVCLRALVCFEMCVWLCVSVIVHIYALYSLVHKETDRQTDRQSSHKHILTAHWQRDLCGAKMTLKEKEKQANCLIIHQRCNMTEININHHRCRGAFIQSVGCGRECRDKVQTWGC